jgi:predicted N-acetyltransferase YhbS
VSGRVIRGARPDDLSAVRSLLAERGDEDDAVDLQLVADTVGLGGTAVAEVDGVVAATATLLDEQLRVGTVTLGCGQVELVATDPRFEHRGLVRALMQWCHERSLARGHVVQVMIGIPNFYRQFGYSYAIPMHTWARLDDSIPVPARCQVRPAGSHDIPAMAALQETVQAGFDVAMPHQSACWTWLVARDGSQQWVAERSGSIIGTARVCTDDGAMWVGELATVDEEATRALTAAAVGQRADDRPALVLDRAGVPGLTPMTTDHQRADWYYVRVPGPRELFEALRPELSRRLQAHAPQLAGSALLSFWRSHLRFDYGPDGIGPVTEGGPFQAPVSAGGSGLPGDALGALLFGCGAAGLEERFPDAHLGAQQALMHALFPPQTADLLTFYLPT